MSNNYLNDEDYDFIYSRSPRICVDLLVRNGKGQVLLTKRTIEPYINHWHLPGGRIKFRESVIDALNRVAKAELGVALIAKSAAEAPGLGLAEYYLPKLVGICEYTDEIQKGQDRHSISLVHLFEVGDDIELNAQDKYEWCSEMPELVIPPIKQFLIKNKFL